MKLNRNYITPFISLVFLVVGISGLLMFFHLFDGYTEVVHEVLGVFFIVCAIFHIILNWKPMKVHLKKGVFLPALFSVLTVSVLLIISERLQPPVDTIIIGRIVKAPVIDAFKALGINYDSAAEKLQRNGISIEKATTLEEIWIMNNADPE
ncbi:MAG: DUF4405 domain-containing protein, partial [Sphingobacteriales bacterium]